MKRIIASAGLSTLATFASYEESFGQVRELGIYPPLVRINALPNAQVRTPYTIVNKSETEILSTIKLMGYKASNDENGSISYYPTGATPAELKNLINEVKFFDGENQIKSIKLYPKESKNLIMEFIAPENEKDYYFSVGLFEESDSAPKNEETVVKITNVLASNVLLSVGPSQQGTARVTEFTTSGFKLGGPAIFKLQVNNSSRNFVSTTGNVSIYNLFGEKVGSVELKPAITLANSQRYLVNNKSSNLKEVTWDEGFTFGFYTAKAVVQVNKTMTIEKSTSFISIPLSVLLFVVVILFIVLSIMHRVLKKINFKTQ